MSKFSQAWAKNNGLRHHDLRKLVTLAEDSKLKMERVLNEPMNQQKLSEASQMAINKFEAFATELGFSTSWPGLYPLLQKNDHDIHLPRMDEINER